MHSKFIIAQAIVTATLLIPVGKASATEATRPLKEYAHRLVLKRWHSDLEWREFKKVVDLESKWDPCAYNPQSHDCSYSGYSACGIPQADPCPRQWRGRLRSTARRQIRWMIWYISRNYGRPSTALEAHYAKGYY